MRTAVALIAKDLRLELRTRESVPAMALFAVSTLVVFHFALDRDSFAGELAAGTLWVALLLAAVLGIGRLFVTEHNEGGFEGFLLAPVERTTLLLAKAFTLFLYLCVVELVVVTAFTVLLLGPSPLAGLPGLVLVLILTNIGIAVVGTLVSSLAVHTRARELLVATIALPLLVPLITAATQATAPLLSYGSATLPGRWLAVIGLYNMVFMLVAYALFDYVLDD